MRSVGCGFASSQTRNFNSIDPILNAPLPGHATSGPTNTSIAELDLTSYTAPVVAELRINDTDALALVTREQLRAVAGRDISNIWAEITRVLAGLGYPVSKRRDAWW